MIDPYLGYIASGSDNTGSSLSGTDMGLRLGWTNLGLGLGVDATVAGTYTYKSGGVSTNTTPMHTGVFVSYKFPILVRAYVTYFVNAKVSMSSPISAAVTGNANKIGVQYTGFPFIALGVELYSMNYVEAELLGIKVPASGSESQTRVALSVPFNL